MQAKTLIPTGTAVAATGVVGGLASRPANSSWYRSLRKPSYQPPRQAFPIVWPMLYADIAIVSSNVLDAMRLWCAFATVLASHVWALNRRRES